MTDEQGLNFQRKTGGGFWPPDKPIDWEERVKALEAENALLKGDVELRDIWLANSADLLAKAVAALESTQNNASYHDVGGYQSFVRELLAELKGEGEASNGN